MHALPAQSTRLIGREAEVAAVDARLCDPAVRLLTITGPGGVGKTRLALAVANRARDAFPDGVVFVDLSPLRDAGLVLPTIARALGAPETDTRPPEERIAAAVGDRALLLVLDNFEQLLDTAPKLPPLLAACPRLTLLVTSRAALRLRDEHAWPVPPLATPPSDSPGDLPALAEVPAVTLFVARARERLPDFALTPDNAAAVAAICRRLEGLPLAIELAAGRLPLLPPAALLARLDHALAVLAGGPRDAPQRQRTLRATLDCSHDLLNDGERALFRRLAVFVGGWTLEAAEAVCADEHDVDVVEGLAVLVDHSLVRPLPDGPAGEPRFQMLETVREYAAEQLADDPQADVTRRRHAEFFLALAERTAPELHRAQQALVLGRLEAELDNLRAALRWTVGARMWEPGLRLAAALHWFWIIRGHLAEGQQWSDQLLGGAVGVDLRLRASLGVSAASLASLQGDCERAYSLLDEALALALELQDRQIIAHALNILGRVAYRRGDTAGAQTHYEESLALFRQLGFTRDIAGLLNNLGIVTSYEGDLTRARALYEESAATFRELGDLKHVAMAIRNLAGICLDQGEQERAEALYQESLALDRQLGDTLSIAICFEGLATVAVEREQMERAARLLGAAAPVRAALGAPRHPKQQERYERAVRAARSSLGEDVFESAYADGQSLSADAAVDEALAAGDPVGAAPHAAEPLQAEATYPTVLDYPEREDVSAASSGLSARELEVLRLLAAGKSNREIADALVISLNTVARHVSNIFDKVGAQNRTEVAAFAHRHGLAP